MGATDAGLIQAIRGPVILITIGVLFTVDHFGGYSFGRTWPVILIIVGLLKLMERGVIGPQQGPQQGQQ